VTNRILIVDDEPNIVISLEYLLKKEGFEVKRRHRRRSGLAPGRRVPSRPDAAGCHDAEEVRLRGLRILAYRCLAGRI
jgi:DNA-binding NtrC family response regulator